MATESAVRMIETTGARNWPINKDTASFASSTSNVTTQELRLLLQGPGFHGNRNVTAPSRSGSAPPSMEGSTLAIGDLPRYQNSRLEGIFENLSNAVETSESEEQLRADPAYHAYYYSNVNLNPRLPQPLVSRENRRLVHHIGGSGENWAMTSFDDSSKRSFLSRQLLSTHKEEPEDDRSPRMDSEGKVQPNSGFISGQYASPLQGRHKSLVDLIQEDFPRTPSPVYNNQSRLSSQGTVEQADPDSCVKALQESSINISKGESKIENVGVRARTPIPSAHSVGSSPNNDLASSMIPCSTSSDATVNPHPRRKGELSTFNANMDNGILPSDRGISSIGSNENETKSLRLSNDGHRGQLAFQHPQQDNVHSRGTSVQVQIGQSQMVHQGMPSSSSVDQFSLSPPKLPSSVQPVLPSAGSTPPLYATAAAYGNHYYPNLQTSSVFPQFGVGGYALNTSLVPPFITGYPPYTTVQMPFESPASPNFNGRTSGLSGGNMAPVADLQHLYKFYGQFGMAGQTSFADPIYMPYLQHPSADAYARVGQYDPMASRGSTIGSPAGNYDPQRGFVLEQRPHIVRSGAVNNPSARKSGATSPNHSGNPQNVAALLHYPSSPLTSPVFQGSPVAAGRRNENMRFQVNTGRTGGAFSGWQGQRSREKVDELKTHSFLEELKSSKSRRYELSDIAGHIVEFSADQHGSRFIQQKLETCNDEGKASVFEEVLPRASTLMTDVFGNYVIQKFFEHGSPVQRKELANKLVGNILPLSLQMYGCRVIQKALEVIELDQKTQLVHELDGHVMRCVRDQNGNHVIQKCIECVPTEKIDFIISSFRGNVVTLSMHPYGCRVIQRVLEHCTDELQSQCIIDEILQSACILAQDQYGNYVTQHVLERGRPLERSQIISKLAGQIVQMSQHKFASNVIEKCLVHGSPDEQALLIEEIVGQTEGNDNLLVMMKDQFANYVVQKVLETCNDRQQEILLGRIKVHLEALRKYTYGKHIVARVEQLCGEDSLALES